jgi:hypothetical protein
MGFSNEAPKNESRRFNHHHLMRRKCHYPIKEDLDMAVWPLATPSVEEISLHNPKRMGFGAIIISCGMEEMPLSRITSTDRVMAT